VLFTGAGFSAGVQTESGVEVPSADGLARALWEIAFPEHEFDGPSLGDVYEAALQKQTPRTTETMRDLLSVDPNNLDEGYRLWFSFPWHRIYTVNIDNLEQAAERAFDLPRPLRVLSALKDAVPPSETDRLQVVHLNGTLDDVPEVTFSSRQYGQRLASTDLWYANLAIEIQTHPVLYVGTSLNEPPLWMYIEARGAKRTEREMRPGSFLVTPALSRAKDVALSTYNVSWVKATVTDFSSEVLAKLADEASVGLETIERRSRVESAGPAVLRVADVQKDSRDDEREFLLGREPRWSDLTTGFAIDRAFDRDLAEAFAACEKRLFLITGTAGSGKSTSAMRLALQESGAGKEVYILNRDAAGSLQALRRGVASTEIDLLLIDDADRFGDATVELIGELLEDSPAMQIVACVRSSRLRILDELKDSSYGVVEKTVPLLEADDTEALLDALDEANRLGQLKGKTRKQQRELMQATFGRQLLVALLEVTQGVRFEEKIESECRQLEGDAPLLYAIASLATYAGAPLADQELVAASGDATTASEELQRLLGRHLLIRTSSERIAVRHSVIAERVVRYYQSKGVIAQVFTALISGLASNARIGELRVTRSGRLLIRLLNHEYLIRLVYRGKDHTADVDSVRAIYDAVEPLLNSDYHYWLQRGSFETKEDPGELALARNFLDQARSMASDDAHVRTQWSYMMLKRASRRAGEAGVDEDARIAFEELEDVIATRGNRDFYPFHVYGSQGLAWAHRAPLSADAKKRLLEQLRRVVDDGLRAHPGSSELRDLKKDLDREYMMLAVER
jgi:hypothetical protein